MPWRGMRHLIKYAIIPLLLTACTALLPRDEVKTSPGGVVYTRHINYPTDNPCKVRGWNSGCFAQMVDGSKHIYISDIAPEYVVKHEEAHVDGMSHTPWSPMSGCAIVVRPDTTGIYEEGDRICATQYGESITRFPNKKAEKE